MSKLKTKWWAKAVAAVLCIFSVLLGTTSFFAMLFEAEVTTEDLSRYMNEHIADNYAAAILNAYSEAADEAQFVSTIHKMVDPKLKFAIVKATEANMYEDAKKTAYGIGAFEKGAQYLYGDAKTVEKADYVYGGGENYYYKYSLNSLISMLTNGYVSGYRVGPEESGVENVQWICYDADTGIFYYATDSGFYPVHAVVINTEKKQVRYELTELSVEEYTILTNGKKESVQIEDDIDSIVVYKYVDMFGNVLEKDSSKWVTVQLENASCVERELIEEEYLVYDDPGNLILKVDNLEFFTEQGLVHGYENSHVQDGMLVHEDLNQQVYYYVFSYVDDTVSGSSFYSFFDEAKEWIAIWESFVHYAVILEVLSVLVFFACFIFLMYAAGARAGKEEVQLGLLDRIWFEVISLGAFLLDLGIGALFAFFFTEGYFKTINFITIETELAFLFCLVILLYCMTIATRVKAHSFWRYTFLYWCYKIVKKIWGKCFGTLVSVWQFLREGHKKRKEFYRSHVSLMWRAVVGLVLASLVFVISFALLCVGGFQDELYVLWVFIFLILMWLFTLAFVMQVTKLREGGERIASGDLSTPIDTKGLKGGFKSHAENINKVSEGIAQAVERQMKSERFKTELITNVSHDIKTPLTSIINYVDLIKKEKIEDEKLQEYIEVLDRQSSRLKKLIEDLMEASKASTGNLAVNFESCDARVLLTQIVGEFEEKTKASQLDMIVENPKEAVHICVDSRHIWRVFDNLLNNICKYAQPSTRVYINLVQEGNEAVITFKNISKYQLNITSEELLERFVRGDSSRNTEGSGLGLSIAQSLTNLMKGTLTLAVDGDLFKVTLRFPIVQ